MATSTDIRQVAVLGATGGAGGGRARGARHRGSHGWLDGGGRDER